MDSQPLTSDYENYVVFDFTHYKRLPTRRISSADQPSREARKKEIEAYLSLRPPKLDFPRQEYPSQRSEQAEPKKLNNYNTKPDKTLKMLIKASAARFRREFKDFVKQFIDRLGDNHVSLRPKALLYLLPSMLVHFLT